MESQYRSILKATSIFGGTQLLQILVGLARSKFVALLVGTIGMGMNFMYMSSLTIYPIAGVITLVVTIYYLNKLNQKTSLINSFVSKFRQR